MPASIDKRAVLQALRACIDEDLERVTASQRDAVEGFTHEEAKAEGDKDMRSTEVSYLARGLAKRVTELREAAAALAKLALRDFGEDDGVALTALVTLEDEDGAESYYFLAPAGGGEQLEVAGKRVFVVTPVSPLGQLLLGKREGDEVERRTPKGEMVYTVESIS